MENKTKGIVIGGCLILVLLGLGAVRYYIQTGNFMNMVKTVAVDKVTEALGLPLEVGSLEISSLHTLIVRNFALYDKQAKCITAIDEVEVKFSPLAVFNDNPLDAINEVNIRGMTATLAQRDDESWNLADLSSGQETTTEFHAPVNISDGRINLKYAKKELSLTDIDAKVDFENYPAVKVEGTAKNQGANLALAGVFDGQRQIFRVEAENIEAVNYLSWLTPEILPAEVQIMSGRLDKAKVSVFRRHDIISLCGDAKYSDGKVTVADTLIEDIHGTAFFTENDVLLDVEAAANEQKARAHGKLRWDTSAPYMDFQVTSDSFDPGKVLTNLPWQGALKFTATVQGEFDRPTVSGEFAADVGAFDGIPWQNAKFTAQLENNMLSLHDFHVDVMGGGVRGEGKLNMDDLSYVAHMQPQAVNVALARQYLPYQELEGILNGDVGINGKGIDLDNLQAYGTANITKGSLQKVPLEVITASFYVNGQDVTVDHATAKFVDASNLGAEGKIWGGNRIDLDFYGMTDMGLAAKFVPQADISGWGNFRGNMQGELANPHIELTMTGSKGKLFKQPFDSLHTELVGTLDNLEIKDFYMEKDAKEVWQVKGKVGLIGEKRLDLVVDTMGARLEDIVALVSPGQPLTGSFDNIIKITGNLENPAAVGYIHMYRGSYNGMLLSGMDGDYTIEDEKVTLQDFHIFSPLIDMDLNGTADTRTRALDMKVVVHNIDTQRFKHKFPYDISGQGTFDGTIGGTFDQPNFTGLLNMPELTLNGYTVTNLIGEVTYEDEAVSVREFGFAQQDGRFDLNLTVDPRKDFIDGHMNLAKADVGFLLAVANQKSDLLEGTLDSQMTFGGSLSNVLVNLTGVMPKGKLAGFDVHDIGLKAVLSDNVLSINRLSGYQGDEGEFSAVGKIYLEGKALDLQFKAVNLAAGMFAKLAGLDINAVGTANISADIGGSADNPLADVQLNILNGGIQGSTFDTLNGLFHVADGKVEVQNFSVNKQILQTHYQASLKGVIPLAAIFAGGKENLPENEQMHLFMSLDDADLSLLPLLSPNIEWSQGDTDGNVEISGTPASPFLRGEFVINDGSLKIKNIYKPVEDMRVKLVFSGHDIELTECLGRMGQGTYSLQGSTSLQGLTPLNYSLSLTLDNLDVQSEFFKGPVTAQFSLSDKTLNILDRQTIKLPMLSGVVNLDNCLLSFPSIPESEGEMPNILLDCTLNLGKKVNFYSPLIGNMNFTGSAHFAGTTQYPKSSGTISVMRGGTINYMKSAIFKIEEGEAHFNQTRSFLPSLNFHAQTRVGHTKVFLDVTGPLGKELKFDLTSSPEMSQTEILQLLTTRSESRAGQKISASDVLAMGLQMGVLSEVEDATRRAFNFDVLSVSRGSSSLYNRDLDDNTYNLQVGKYLNDKVMLRYAQDFGHSHESRFGVQYDFDDHFSASVDREGSRFVYGLEAKIKF